MTDGDEASCRSRAQDLFEAIVSSRGAEEDKRAAVEEFERNPKLRQAVHRAFEQDMGEECALCDALRQTTSVLALGPPLLRRAAIRRRPAHKRLRVLP